MLKKHSVKWDLIFPFDNCKGHTLCVIHIYIYIDSVHLQAYKTI